MRQHMLVDATTGEETLTDLSAQDEADLMAAAAAAAQALSAPSQPERFDALVDDLTPSLQDAQTVDQVKVVVGQALSGLKAIYGAGG